MAKNKIIKRIVAKDGVRYYQNGKRITAKKGARLFIRQNPNAKSLSDREKRSQKALKNYQKAWKFKGVAKVQEFYVTLLDILEVIDKDNVKDNDLYNVFENGKRKFNNFEDLKKEIDNYIKPNKNDTPEQRERKKKLFQFCTEKGLPGYRGRDFDTFANNRLTNIVDIVELLDTKSFKYYTLIVINENGEKQRGRILALLALRDFEIRVSSQIKKLVSNSAFIRFCYDYQVDPDEKTITINLIDNKPTYKVKEGEDKGEDKVKDLKWYVDNSGGTSEKQSLDILDKFEDVEITIEFS